MDYQSFKKEYEASKLNQKMFSLQKGISQSMVSYYLRRARQEVASSKIIKKDLRKVKMFEKIDIKSDAQNIIKIKLPGGIEIEVPV